MTRIETAQEHALEGTEPLIFGIAGLISGFGTWQFGGHFPQFLTFQMPTGLQKAPMGLGPPLVFATMLAVALFVTGAASRLERGPLVWIGGFLAVVGLYVFVVGLLFFGYFSQLFHMPGWLNFALCGFVGAFLLACIAGAVLGVSNGPVMGLMCIAGLVSGLVGVGWLGKWNTLFLYPWWQGAMATLIGFWVQSATEE